MGNGLEEVQEVYYVRHVVKGADGTREILSLTSIGTKLDKLLERADPDPVCHFDARGFEAHQHGDRG